MVMHGGGHSGDYLIYKVYLRDIQKILKLEVYNEDDKLVGIIYVGYVNDKWTLTSYKMKQSIPIDALTAIFNKISSQDLQCFLKNIVCNTPIFSVQISKKPINKEAAK